jgi:hypothetical protein
MSTRWVKKQNLLLQVKNLLWANDGADREKAIGGGVNIAGGSSTASA